jgi:hypothetical protein
MRVSHARRPKDLEKENAQLEKLVANQVLDSGRSLGALKADGRLAVA